MANRRLAAAGLLLKKEQMNKMEHVLQINPDATVGDYVRTQRLCEVTTGADVRLVRRRYRVDRTSDGIVLVPYQNRQYSNPTSMYGSHLHYGLNCQLWVEVCKTVLV
jgi:hypothetical protein